MEERTLANLDFQSVCRSSNQSLGVGFLGVCLEHSKLYRRAVAFFSSSVFLVSAKSWMSFFESGGQARFIISPHLSTQDIRALRDAVLHRPRVQRAFSMKAQVARSMSSKLDVQQLLSGLVATDHVAIKVACRAGDTPYAIYHEKIGAFSDGNGHLIAFSGSANESRSAYVTNFERIDVFSKQELLDRHRAFTIEAHFQELWHNQTPGVEVIQLNEAVLGRVFIERSSQVHFGRVGGGVVAKEEDQQSCVPEVLVPAPDIVPRDHQREAIRAWAKAGGRGVLEMATGSGKTITALTLASKLYDAQGSPLVVLIVVPLIHLVDQWRKVAKMYGLNPIKCAEGTSRWYQALSSAIDSVNSQQRPVLSIVTTGATMQTEPFQRLISGVRAPFLLIADEMHNYGATGSFHALPDNATARVGLSATPDRAFDDEGNQKLTAYFGDTVFAYGLKEALNDNVLTPYLYYPTIVELDEEESDAYIELSEKIGRFSGNGDEDESSPYADVRLRLLIRRARLVAAARNKLPRLKELLAKHKKDRHILVYCGDGSTIGREDSMLVRQIDETIRIVGRELGMKCARYTAETTPRRRQELLEQFATGEIQVLVAIRCLDEGVDVPATRRAFMLASSTNPRQFVQRRGRVLRQHPGKSKAEIHDFFVCLPRCIYTKHHPSFQIARSLIRNQLSRVLEFATLASNGAWARNELLELRDQFNLLGEG